MIDFDELANDEAIKKEYKKTLLLTIFKKFCVKMEKNETYKNTIRNIYRQSYDKNKTTKILMERDLFVTLNLEEVSTLTLWVDAYLRKSNFRKPISLDLKKKLYLIQNGKCISCGEDLGDNWSKIHVDHIIPFKLVGDELDNNYQDLCETCNECKNAKTDYIFNKMINLK